MVIDGGLNKIVLKILGKTKSEKKQQNKKKKTKKSKKPQKTLNQNLKTPSRVNSHHISPIPIH
jgi:hypothetical protein